MQNKPSLDKQAWILETRRKMLLDSKAMTLPASMNSTLLQKPQKKPEKLAPILPKIFSKAHKQDPECETFEKKEIFSTMKVPKSEIFLDKQKKIFIEQGEKPQDNQIPDPGEWEFEDENADDYMRMMEDFDEKMVQKSSQLSELEKMELEHKKLKGMSQRIAMKKK